VFAIFILFCFSFSESALARDSYIESRFQALKCQSELSESLAFRTLMTEFVSELRSAFHIRFEHFSVSDIKPHKIFLATLEKSGVQIVVVERDALPDHENDFLERFLVFSEDVTVFPKRLFRTVTTGLRRHWAENINQSLHGQWILLEDGRRLKIVRNDGPIIPYVDSKWTVEVVYPSRVDGSF